MTSLALALVSTLLAASPVHEDARTAAVRRELSEVATRIEQMKAAGVRRGAEIESLLARSQGLAAELELLERRAPPEPTSEGGDPQELRERADTLRDEVDRLQAALADVDHRLREEGRRRRAGRLARMEEEGALFSEASPGRVGTSRPGGTTSTSAPGPTAPGGPGAPGPTEPSGPSGSGAPESPSPADSPSIGAPPPPAGPGDVEPPPAAPTAPEFGAPPTAEPDRGGAPGTHVWSSPGVSRSWSDRLTPARGDGAPELRRKRDAIVAAIGDAQRRIQRIEEEARELDSRP